MKWHLLLLLAAGGLVFARDARFLRRRDAGTLRLGQRAGGTPTWNYADHGESWYLIGSCGDADGQSPINISDAANTSEDDGQKLFYRYDAYTRPIKMANDRGGLVGAIDGEAGAVALGRLYPTQLNASYSLKEIQIHSPSEHTFRGQRVPLELQLLHRGGQPDGAGDDLLVVAVGFASTAFHASPFLDALRQGGLPDQPGAAAFVNRESPAALAFDEVFGGGARFWQYEGSATTPPCSLGAQWLVREQVLPASGEAVNAFREAIVAVASIGQDDGEVGNARMLQAIGGRQIRRRSAVDAAAASGPAYNATFDNALGQAEDALAEVNREFGLSGDGGQGAAQASSPAAVQSAPAKQICLQNLQGTYDELAASQARAVAECQAVDRMNTTATAAASPLLANQVVLCQQEKHVLAALRLQAEAQQAECDRLGAA